VIKLGGKLCGPTRYGPISFWSSSQRQLVPEAAAAATTNAFSVAIAAICWLIVVHPPCCLCFHRCCLPPPLPLLAANVIGDSRDCGNGCGGNGGSGDGGAFRSFSGMMFKILHIKSKILNIKLDKKEGGGRRMGGLVD